MTWLAAYNKVVVPTVITLGAGKAVRKDAAFQILAKRLANIGVAY